MPEIDLIHAYTLFTDGNCAMELSKKYGIPYVVAVRNTDVNDFFKKFPWLRKRLIHAYTLFTDGNCAMELSKKYGIPYVVAVRNTDVNDFFKKFPWLRKRGAEILRCAARVFFLSPVYRDQVFAHYIPEELKPQIEKKTEIVPNGIDDFWLKMPPEELLQERLNRLQKKELRVIYAGRIDRNKNIPSTIQALEQMAADGWKVAFTVVGKVADEKVFEQIRRSPLLHYVPAQPKEPLRELYRQHDIFVMPSFTETFGLVYAEAMSQGLPVVYSEGQGFDGQFPEGTVGYHADPHSVAQIRDAIEKTIAEYQGIAGVCPGLEGQGFDGQFPEGTVGYHADPHSVAQIRDAIEKTIAEYQGIAGVCPGLAQRFCWGQIVSRYEQIYRQIIDGEIR